MAESKIRKSFELEEKEWQALDGLAQATGSLSRSNNEFGGKASWRVLIQRVAQSERCGMAIQEALHQDRLDEIILNWQNMWEELPDEEIVRYEAGLNEVDKKEWQAFFADRPVEAQEIKWHVAKNLFYQRSLAEARRLGYEKHPEIIFNHNPIALIEVAKGYDAGRELMDKWGFGSNQPHPDNPAHIMPHYEPGTMWDIMAWRRDGEAIIAAIGDDRGWKDHWTYYIAVAWSPKYLEAAYGPTYSLV